MSDDESRQPTDARPSTPPALEGGPVPTADVGGSETAAAGAPALEGGAVPTANVDAPGQQPPDGAAPDSPDARKPEPSGLGCFMAMGGILFGLMLGSLGGWLVCGAQDEEPPETVDVLRESPNVVVAIQDLARLETTSFHVERVIDLVARQRQLFGLVEAEDAILLVAAGDVVAGVDLTRMQDGDVVIEPETNRATITLPEPEIFSARLDNERTYVHTRDTDLTARRDPHLETRARREAERTLREAAIDAGIMERARANAETAVGTLVRSLGYDHVTLRFREAEANPER